MHEDHLNLPQDRVAEGSFYCPRCLRSYPEGVWAIESSADDDDPIGSWYCCAEITCPDGHSRHADLAIFSSRRDPRRHPVAAHAAPRGPHDGSFWGRLAAFLRT